jgi:hypothetical protein
MKTLMRSMIVLLSLTALLNVASPRAEAAVCTWNGTTGDWNFAANWSCGAVPGASDEAIISSGTVNVTEDASVGSLTMSGGTLTGDHDLTAGTINWSGGTMSGSGSTTATDAVNFTGSSQMVLQDRTFNNAGTATWNRTGYLNLQTASTVFNNQVGATFTVQSSGSAVVGGYGTFSNGGTFIKTSPGETENNQFDNSGIVCVESGTLVLNNVYGSSTSSGAYYEIQTGATLRLSGTYAHNLSGVISATGEGEIRIFSGTVNVDGTFTFPGSISIGCAGWPGGTLNLNTDTTTAEIEILTLYDGTVTGPGHLTAGTVNWSGGTMSGTGSTTATDAVNFTGSSQMVLQDRTFNNAGTATWNRTGYLNLQTASTMFNNQAEATFTVQSAWTTVVSGNGTFSNAGTLNLTTGRINAATFVQESGGTTNLTIKGITPVTDYCQIDASVVDLAGPLNVSFASGYTPHVGDEFVLLSYSSTRTGDFSPVNVTPIANVFWTSFYEDNKLILWATTRIYLPFIATESDG